jgi:hypothetical protein
MDTVGLEGETEGSRTLTTIGWLCLALGSLAPLRAGLALFGVVPNLYCDQPAIFCGYAVSLGALIAGSGYGIVRRRRWAPLAGSVASGATIALGCGSLILSSYIHLYVNNRRGSPENIWAFFRDQGGFLFGNSVLLAGGTTALVLLLRPKVRREFTPGVAGPAVLLGAAMVSSAACLAITGYFWVRFVL